MRRYQWKRNAVVAVVLVFVCAAVYLNWRYAGSAGDTEMVDAPAESQGETTRKVLGDAALVGGEIVTDETPVGSYFDSARLSRQKSRDGALSLLREASEQEGAEQKVLDEANLAIQTIAGYAMQEAQIENLVVAKGYADCVAFMGKDSISVVVSADELETQDIARITDIVLDSTDYTADQIRIAKTE